MSRYAALSFSLALLLAGCGFHLRGYELNTSVSAVQVVADGRNLANEPLRRGLRQAGVNLVEQGEEAELIVELLDDRRDRRSVAVTDQARAAEYETSIGIEYSVSTADGAALIEPRWVQTTRIFRVDRVNIVGANQEQALLEQEMVNDLVQQIIRALDAASRELPTAATDAADREPPTAAIDAASRELPTAAGNAASLELPANAQAAEGSPRISLAA